MPLPLPLVTSKSDGDGSPLGHVEVRRRRIAPRPGLLATPGLVLALTACRLTQPRSASFASVLIPTGRRMKSSRQRHVLALSGYGRFAFGDVPFFGLSMFGAPNNLRGYPVGRYQDRMLLAGQVEYRFHLMRRLGLVAFGGVGAVAPDIGEFRNADALPSGGFGVRYLVAPKNKVNFRVDVAWGKDGDAVYLGVGEAF